MYSTSSYELTKKEYNYLLPSIKSNLLYSGGRYFFIGVYEDLLDALLRLKGLYDNFNEGVSSTLVYNCSKSGSIDLFRTEMLGKA